MKLFNKVAIIGTGLIGGSLALAIKKKQLAREVVGVSRRRSSLLSARKRGAIDRGSLKLEIVKGADLLIFATPVNKIISLAPLVSKIISKDCIVTDVGSTKASIVLCLEKTFSNYVGSHPLAGSEKRGMINATANIFQDSLCILTPTRNTNRTALIKLRQLWKQLGARTVLLSPASHDTVLSFVSHLPHVAAFSLIGIIPGKFLRHASASLKDTTRIAGSESELWVDIFLHNRRNILRSIKLLEDSVSDIKKAIQKKDREKLALILKKAKAKRELLG